MVFLDFTILRGTILNNIYYVPLKYHVSIGCYNDLDIYHIEKHLIPCARLCKTLCSHQG